MVKIDHTSRAHAKLSASGSEKWLNCPGSVSAESGYPNTTSVFAKEGTVAHEVANLALISKSPASFYVGQEIEGFLITETMANYVQKYLDYVEKYINENSTIFIEERVDYSNYAKDGFGTVDFAQINYKDGICRLIDFKYGKGVSVKAEENTQGQMYALGLLNLFIQLEIIEKFEIHIVQPRLNIYDSWSLPLSWLEDFGEYVKKQSKLALKQNAPRLAGRHCLFCKAKRDCKEYEELTSDKAKYYSENTGPKRHSDGSEWDDYKWNSVMKYF